MEINNFSVYKRNAAVMKRLPFFLDFADAEKFSKD
jgi:hypothetical protein